MDTTSYDIVKQLLAFGYNRDDIRSAFDTATKEQFYDINNITEVLDTLQYNKLNKIGNVSAKQHHASHNSLMVFGYTREVYEDKYNKHIPTDIKWLCSDYSGYALCCIACFKDIQDLNVLSHDFEVGVTGFFNSHKCIYTLQHKHSCINVVRAYFTSIITNHKTCFNHLNNATHETHQFSLNGCKRLFVAAEIGNTELVKQMIETGKDALDGMNNNERTPLWIASFFGHFDIIQRLILYGSDINHCDLKGFFPLFVAAQNGHTKVVQLLLKHNANVNQCEHSKRTALWTASLKGHFEVVRVLLSHPNIDVNIQNAIGGTALYAASQNNHFAVVELLFTHANRADPNLGKNDGCTPLWIAANRGNIECVKLLMKYDASLNIQDKTQGATPLFVASQNGHESVVEKLLEAKVDINTHRSADGSTPLMMAAHNGHIGIVEKLLECGADISLSNFSRLSAVTCSAMQGHYEIIQVLYAHLVTVKSATEITEFVNKRIYGNGVHSGWTPFHLACMGGYGNVIKYLVETMNVELFKTDFDNKTGMVHASENGYHSIVHWLQKKAKSHCVNGTNDDDVAVNPNSFFGHTRSR